MKYFSCKYKKFISVFLISCLVFSSIINIYAYESLKTEENHSVDIIKQFITLKKLNVFSFDNIEEAEVDKKVTRAEFADYTIKTLGIEGEAEKIYFSDVKLDHWAADSINLLVKFGAVDGTRNGTFEPDEFITYEQACKILLSLAGYRGFIEAQNHNNMMSYVMYAKRFGLGPIVGVNNSDVLAFSDVVQLLYNAMKMNSVIAIDDNATVDHKTLFEAYRNVYIVKGRMETWFGGSITNCVSETLDEVYVDSEKYTIDNDVKVEMHFGNMVEITYLKDSKDSKKIIYMENCESEDMLIETDRVKGFNLTEYKLSYYKDKQKERETTVNIDKGAKVIYNGEISNKRITDICADIINNKLYGTIKLIKSDNEGYDLLIFKVYKDFVITTYDEVREIYYGNSIDIKSFDISDYSNISIFDNNHNKITLPKAKNTVISISSSEGGQYLEIVQCLDIRKGVVERIYPSDKKIVISETKYELTKFCESQVNLSSLINLEIEFTLNLEGKISNIGISGGENYKIGYITNLAVKDLAFEHKPIIRMYLPDSAELKVFEFAENVKIDGIAYKSEDFESIFKSIPGVTVVLSNGKYTINVSRQIIRYMCNKNGEINGIDTYKLGSGEETKNSLTRTHDGTVELRYLANNSRFGMNCIYDANKTKLIFVPQVNEKGEIEVDDRIIAERINLYNSNISLTNDRMYYVESYKLNEKNYYQDIIVIRVTPSREDETAFMFNEIRQVLDEEDGVAVSMIVGINSNKEVSYRVSDMSLMNDIEQGDIIRVDIDSSGEEVLKITKLFDVGTMSLANNIDGSYFYSGTPDKTGLSYRVPKYNLSKVFVHSINDGILRSTYDFYDMDKDIYDEMIVATRYPITVFDSENRNNVVSVGKTSDIVGYDVNGANCSMIVTFAYYGTIKQLFVYNNYNK